jgi:hypothetical protein
MSLNDRKREIRSIQRSIPITRRDFFGEYALPGLSVAFGLAASLPDAWAKAAEEPLRPTVILHNARSGTQGPIGDPPPLTDGMSLYQQYRYYRLSPQAQHDGTCCWAYSVIGALELELSRHYHQPIQLSGRYLQLGAEKDDHLAPDHQGSNFGRAVRALEEFGICSLDLCPPSTSQITPLMMNSAIPLGSGLVVDWVRYYKPTGGLTESEMRAAKKRLDEGHPLAIGMRWPKNLKVASNDVCLLGECEKGDVIDGHCVTVVGYEDNPQYPGGGCFLIRNTWGQNWMLAGYARMSYNYFQSYANDMLSFRYAPNDLFALKPSGKPITNLTSDRVCDLKGPECKSLDNAPLGRDRIGRYKQGLWLNDDQVFFMGKSLKSGFKIEIDAPVAGLYALELAGTRAPDYGVYSFHANSHRIGDPVDFTAVSVGPTGTLNVGSASFKKGANAITVLCEGKNPVSQGYLCGLDWVRLRRDG